MGDNLSWLQIDLKALDRNIQSVGKVVGDDKFLFAVVKANAYGHGLFAVASQAIKSGADYLVVATAAEAFSLRKQDIIHPIIIMGAASPEEIKQLIRSKVTMVAYDAASWRRITRTAEIMQKKVLVHLKVDTGLHRLGFSPDEVIPLLRKYQSARSRYVEVEGIYTHLAAVEEVNQSYTKGQLLELESLLSRLNGLGKGIKYVSAAASAASVMVPDSRFNSYRLGIMMYGLWPSREVQAWAKKHTKSSRLKLKPVLSWKTKLVQVKKVRAGESIGYGLTYTAKKTMTIGVIPVGYYDGFPRHLSNMGFALLKGAVVPVVGRVCMNMTMLDISKLPQSKPGDTITLIGTSQSREITAQDLADWADTINYEVVSRLPEHLPRVLVK